MPRSVDEGFNDFLSKLTPTLGESDAAKRHRASIKANLEANFDVKNFFRSGSFGNGSSISGYRDVDYFASIARSDCNQNSGTTLSRVRDVLNQRFPSTGVCVSCPAVSVPFGTDAKESTEVVPADYMHSTYESHRVYEIASCSGGWMRSSPDAHNTYVQDADQRWSNRAIPDQTLAQFADIRTNAMKEITAMMLHNKNGFILISSSSSLNLHTASSSFFSSASFLS